MYVLYDDSVSVRPADKYDKIMKRSKEMSHIIGIDFGSTNTTVACVLAGRAEIITDENGNESFPSMVSVNENGGSAVGYETQKRFVLHPNETFFGLKRLLGSKLNNKDIADNPGLVCDEESTYAIVNGKKYSLELLSAAILMKAKRIAEKYFDEKIDEAVVTVPAYFSIPQRYAVKKAGELAGLNIKRIISEPTAAALAYGSLASDTKPLYHDNYVNIGGKIKAKRHIYGSKDVKIDGKIMVIDFGGGTFDVSILEVGDGVFEVMSTNGNTRLGGEDFDSAIAKHIIDDIERKYGEGACDDYAIKRRILNAAKTAKEELSSCSSTEITLPYLLKTEDGLVDYSYNLTQDSMEKLISDFLDKMGEPIMQALSDAHLDKKDIDKIILVGGMTRMPIIRTCIKKYFGKEPSYGINPNTAVAIGAAIQAGVLDGRIRDVLLLDVTPLTLGIEMKDGVVSPLIPRNTTFPTFKKEVFTTTDRKKTGVNIHIVQGEQKYAKDNESLGYITIDDLNPKLKGDAQIEVTFSIDQNGILSVSAENKNTHKRVSLVVDGDIEAEERVEYTNHNQKSDEQSNSKAHWWNR